MPPTNPIPNHSFASVLPANDFITLGPAMWNNLADTGKMQGVQTLVDSSLPKPLKETSNNHQRYPFTLLSYGDIREKCKVHHFFCAVLHIFVVFWFRMFLSFLVCPWLFVLLFGMFYRKKQMTIHGIKEISLELRWSNLRKNSLFSYNPNIYIIKYIYIYLSIFIDIHIYIYIYIYTHILYVYICSLMFNFSGWNHVNPPFAPRCAPTPRCFRRTPRAPMASALPVVGAGGRALPEQTKEILGKTWCF